MILFMVGVLVGAICGILGMALCKVSAMSDLRAENTLLRSKVYDLIS